jgi:hypothetical protein
LGGIATGGILDQISTWLIKASDELAKWKRTRRLTIVQIGGADRVTIASDGKAFETTFTVNDLNLPSSDALLRGMNLEFIGDSRVPISVRARDEITESKEKNPAAGRNAGKESGVYA